MKLGEISQIDNYYNKAKSEIKNLLLVDKSNQDSYALLGECCFALKEWEECYNSFYKAEEILRTLYKYKFHDSINTYIPIDTVRLIYYLRIQGEAKTKLYNSDAAINYFTKAKELTKLDSVKKEFDNYLIWIYWDDGNIRASEIRDDIEFVYQTKNYKKAKDKYIKLLKILKTQHTKNEINWRIASIDYNFLNKDHAALGRMFRVIKKIKAELENNKLSSIYLKDYAAMCFSMAVKYYKKHNYRFAHIYFTQASKIEWERLGECYFQLALLSQANPTENIYNCKQALVSSQQLTPKKVSKIYKMLFDSYKSQGEFEIAKQYYYKLTSNL